MGVQAELVRDPMIASIGRLAAGRYRIRSLLGRGGMSLVWLARDELLHRPVALKQLIVPGRARTSRPRQPTSER